MHDIMRRHEERRQSGWVVTDDRCSTCRLSAGTTVSEDDVLPWLF